MFRLGRNRSGAVDRLLRARSPVNRVSFSLHRFLNAGLRDCITIRPSSSTRTDPSPGNTAKCTFPTTLPTMKSSTLHRAIWGFEPITTSIGRLGVLVCLYEWYPEAARLMALRGADLLIYPTAIGWESSDTAEEKERQRNAWIISQRGHAVANGLPVISVNRVGHEPDPSGADSRHTILGKQLCRRSAR